MTFQCINEKKCEISEKSAIFAIALLHITEKNRFFPNHQHIAGGSFLDDDLLYFKENGCGWKPPIIATLR